MILWTTINTWQYCHKSGVRETVQLLNTFLNDNETHIVKELTPVIDSDQIKR